MLYLKSEYITIEYFATDELVKTKWLEYAPSAEYRKILRTFLRMQKKHRIKKWLADYSDAKVVRPVDQKWTVEEWGPKFFSSLHLRCVAIVNPADVFGRMSVNFIMSQINMQELPVEVCFFDKPEEAIAWLALQGSRR
ncbi:hypothetical protein [Pontibacter mangrovi]|uniref:STAS/SEC14 domain-containing protein n=1 Tax=Pontibacter mangrovi TaxID=2589816 RepID=A0A501VY59_9BACT|nr:hypothetical protein [Pontibacter mangrovi]TPE41020.1 hypothetical protein FJM65_19435 [Pontibacter mangrovi]